MELIKIKTQDDYGKDFFLTLLKIKNWCMIQVCLSMMVYGRSLPYLNITLGSGRLFGFNFQIWKFGICIELLSRCWGVN